MKNLAARIGGFSARHWILALSAWVALVAVLVVAGSAAGQKRSPTPRPPPARAPGPSGSLASGTSTSTTTRRSSSERRRPHGDPAFRSVVAEVRAGARAGARRPRLQAAPERRAERSRARVRGRQRRHDSEETIGAQLAAGTAVAHAHPGYTVETFGERQRRQGAQRHAGQRLLAGGEASRSPSAS